MDRLTGTPSEEGSGPAGAPVESSRDDLVSGGVLLLVAGAYGVGAIGIPGQRGEPGPGFVPLALAVLLAVLSLGIVVGGLRRRAPDSVGGATGDAKPERDGEGGAPDGDGDSDRPGFSPPWLALLATVVYAALFQPAGFVLSTLGYSGYIATLFTRETKLRFGVPVLVTLLLFVFFRLALGVRLPAGLLG